MRVGAVPRIVNQTIPVYWAGWSSDTLTLQKHGWQISAEQNIEYRKMQLAIKHPHLDIYGISSLADFDYYMNMNTRGRYIPLDVRLRFEHIGHMIYYRGPVDLNMFEGMKPIDAYPQMIHETNHRLEDLVHFAPIQQPDQQVYLEQASIDEILELALNKQEPKQEEIRRRIMKERHVEKYGKLHTELRLVA